MALVALRQLFENLSDGNSYPTLDAVRRYHDLCETGLEVIDETGVRVSLDGLPSAPD